MSKADRRCGTRWLVITNSVLMLNPDNLARLATYLDGVGGKEQMK